MSIGRILRGLLVFRLELNHNLVRHGSGHDLVRNVLDHDLLGSSLFLRNRSRSLRFGFLRRRGGPGDLLRFVRHVADHAPHISRAHTLGRTCPEQRRGFLSLLGHVVLHIAARADVARHTDIRLRGGCSSGILRSDKPVAVVPARNIHDDVRFLVLFGRPAGGRFADWSFPVDREFVKIFRPVLDLREQRSRIAKASAIAHEVENVLFHLKESRDRQSGALSAPEHPLEFLEGIVRYTEILVRATAAEVEENLLHPCRGDLGEIRKHAGLVDGHVPYGRLRRVLIFRRHIGSVLAHTRSGLQLAADAVRLVGIVAAGHADRLRRPQIDGIDILRHRSSGDRTPRAQVLAHTHQRAPELVASLPLLRITASRILDIETDAPHQVTRRTFRHQRTARSEQVVEKFRVLLEFGADAAAHDLHADRLPQHIVVVRDAATEFLDLRKILRRHNLVRDLQVPEGQCLLEHHVLFHRMIRAPRIRKIRHVPVAEIPVLPVRIVKPNDPVFHTLLLIVVETALFRNASVHTQRYLQPQCGADVPFCHCTARRGTSQVKKRHHLRDAVELSCYITFRSGISLRRPSPNTHVSLFPPCRNTRS